MPTDSRPRRVAKRLLGRVLPPSLYQRLLAASVVRDLRAGTLREPELDLIPSLLREGETALDIGANHAMWTLAMSRAAGRAGRVVAFEPVPYTAGTFSRVTRRLGLENVELVEAAVAAEAGRLTLSVPIQESGVADSARVHLATRSDCGENRGAEREITVDAVRIDDRLDDLADVALIKIDVEGAEIFALRGATRLIDRDHPAIVSEADPEFLAGFGLTTRDLTGLLAELGYGCWHLEAEGLVAVDVGSELSAGNYVFLHPERSNRTPRGTPTGGAALA